MILLIDNYDSFTYNLHQLCLPFAESIIVARNDKITVDEIVCLKPKAIILSPGPKSPKEAGICIELIQKLAPSIPILGVCLGMQAIGAAFGAQVVRAPFPMHGKAAQVLHSGKNLFEKILQPMIVGRYHSLMVQKESLPSALIQEAITEDGILMGIRHREYPCFGVQFHPESILTQNGSQLIANFINLKTVSSFKESGAGL